MDDPTKEAIKHLEKFATHRALEKYNIGASTREIKSDIDVAVRCAILLALDELGIDTKNNP